MEKRITIQIADKDRHTELALLLQSLRTQTYQAWDVIILDECQTPIMSSHFLNALINRVKFEGHCVYVTNNNLSLGVCNARNLLIERDYFDNPLVCRLDDDVVLEPDYLEKMIKVIDAGYDIASGVTPLMAHPELIRKTSVIGDIINKKEFNDKGEITKHGDDCGYCYDKEKIIRTHEFRSNALMKKEVVEKIKYETNLSPTGFREEGFFSFRAIAEGFTIGVNTTAIAYHFAAPFGGVRSNDYQQRVMSDDMYFKKWVKEFYNKLRGKL